MTTETISLASEPTRTTELTNGLTMTVTAATNSAGKLYHLDQTNIVLETFSLAASQSMTFGPFPTIRKYRLECSAGSLSYQFSKPDFDYSTQLGNVEGFTGNRTLTLSDNGKLLRCDDASAVTITVPNAMPTGFNVGILQWGAGTVTVAAGSGATKRTSASALSAQYAAGSIVIAKNVDGASAEFVLGGSVA
jgi:hypothetical protein